MLHIALAFSEKDSHRTKSDEFMTAFALDYFKRMGWDKTQLIIIRHDDHDYDHIHMALNIIGDDGKTLDMKFYKTRSQRICYKMTKEYGLYFVKDKKNVNRSALKGNDKLKYQVADAAMPLLGKCKSLKEFRDALAKQGTKLPSFRQETARDPVSFTPSPIRNSPSAVPNATSP